MDVPRFARNPRAAASAAVLLGLLACSMARAEGNVTDDKDWVRSAPPVRNDAIRTRECERVLARQNRDSARPEETLTPSPTLLLRCLAALQFLHSICVLSGEEGTPPNTSPPLVVRPPLIRHPEPEQPGPAEIPPTQSVPEPGSLITGLIGSSLGLAAWWRQRRRRPDEPRENDKTLESDCLAS